MAGCIARQIWLRYGLRLLGHALLILSSNFRNPSLARCAAMVNVTCAPSSFLPWAQHTRARCPSSVAVMGCFSPQSLTATWSASCGAAAWRCFRASAACCTQQRRRHVVVADVFTLRDGRGGATDKTHAPRSTPPPWRNHRRGGSSALRASVPSRRLVGLLAPCHAQVSFTASGDGDRGRCHTAQANGL